MHRKLGQHFLINKSAIKTILDSLNLQKGDTVIEIGPGKGALTIPLVERCQKINCKVIGIEKDPGLAKELGSQRINFQIITDDALKFFLDWKFKIDNWKLVGNIPYYITGKLLRILSEPENKPEIIILTVQREVAERITAKPPKMNLLAAITQSWSDPKILQFLKPSDFQPPPEVESAIIKLTPKEVPQDQKQYLSFVKLIFKQPRKTILNNLQTGLDLDKELIKDMLKKQELTGQERASELSVDKLWILTRLFG